MAPRPKPIGSDGGENQSDATSDLTEIFSDNRSDSDYSSDPELDSEVSDEDEPDDNAFDDEGQLPPEHYLAQAESLDVTQLRQKRYSDGTQERLDETRMYWNRYVTLLSLPPIRRLIDGSLADTVGILVLTQCNTGNGSQIQIRLSASYMHFSAGDVISTVARMVATAQGLHTRARLSHSGNGGILF